MLSGFLFWRLVEGPISIDFLTPFLVEAFDAEEALDGQATITGTRLLWDDKRQSLELQVTGLSVDDSEGERSFTLPLANIDFSFGQLLEGKVELTNIELVGARLTVRRNADQGFEVLLFQQKSKSDQDGGGSIRTRGQQLTNPGEAGVAEGETALTVMSDLLSESEHRPIDQLQEVLLLHSQVVVDDQVLGFSWTLPAQRILLQRTPEGLSGELDVGLPLGTFNASTNLAFIYQKDEGTLDIAGQLNGLDTARLAPLLPQVQGLTVVESVLNGDISATLGEDGRLFFVDFELTAGPGRLRPTPDATLPVPITGGAVNGRIDLATTSLSLYDVRFQTGTKEAPGPELTAAASLTPEMDRNGVRNWLLQVSAAASAFSVAELAWLWPSAFGANAHAWVKENITGGTIRQLRSSASFSLSAAGAEALNVSGEFGFEELILHYLRPMPPMRGLGGVAKIERDRLIFDVFDGHSEELSLGPGEVTIFDLDTDLPKILIDMPVLGELADMLEILDHPRLKLMQRAGIDRKGAKGVGRLHVTMGFPLLDDLQSEQMSLSAVGTVSDVLLNNVVLGQAVSAQDVALDATMDRVIIKGEAELAGSRFYADYRQNYDGQMRLSGKGEAIKAETLATLVPALKGRLGGKLASTFKIDGNPARKLTIDIDADVTRASLDLAQVDWRKPAGERASLSGDVVLEGGHLRALDRLKFDGPDAHLAGRFDFTGDSDFTGADLAYLRFPKFDLTNVRVSQEPGLLEISVGGGEIDARQWIESGKPPFEKPGERLEEAKAPTRVEVSVGELRQLLLPAGSLRGVRARFSDYGRQFAFDLAGTLYQGGGAKGEVDLSYGPSPSGGEQAKVDVADLGSLLRALDVYHDLNGGRLTWRASTPSGAPDGPLSGQVLLKNFRLTEIPRALRVIMVAGLTGIEDALEGPGVSFDTLTGDLTVQDDRVSSQQLRAVGSALGILASGWLDVDQDSIDLSGKVVPAYAINRFIDSIPVLGWVITGGEDQGLFAVSYSVSGSLRDPKVTVNPLSALTPPLLRSFVELITDGKDGKGASSGPMQEPQGALR